MNAHQLRERLLARARSDRDGPSDVSWELKRRSYELDMAKAPGPPAVDIDKVDTPDVRGEWLRPAGRRPTRVLLFVHGGGYVMGSVDTHRALAGRVSVAGDASVFLLEYRRAPEHKFPAALDDVITCWSWLLAQTGASNGSIGVVGDSAGGGLAAALVLSLLESGHQVPGALALLSPWLDMTLTSGSLAASLEADPLVDREFLEAARAAYAGGADAKDPLLSPLFGAWHGAPATLIQVAAPERLADDSRHLFDRMSSAGVDVVLEEWDGLIHVWHQFFPLLPESGLAIDRIGQHFRTYLRSSEAS